MRALASANVPFIVVGMFGVNLHARDSSESFVTKDLDLLLRPDTSSLRAALTALSAVGLSFETGGEPFVDVADDDALAAVVRSQTTLRCVFEGEIVADLMLSMTGWTHADVAADAVRFRAFGHDLLVGSLERLIESKRRAGRPKDLAFLAHYEAVMSEKKREE